MKQQLADQELVNQIRAGDLKALEQIYKSNRRLIGQYVLRNSGSEQDAQDLYQEVILAFYRNVAQGRLTVLSGRLSTYLYKLAENLWRNQLRTQRGSVPIDTHTDFPMEEPSSVIQEDTYLQSLIARLDERCRHILLLFYFDRLPMQEVALRVGLPDGESAKKRKYDCLARLKRLADRFKPTDYDTE